MSENTKAAIVAYTGMVGTVGAAILKVKAGSPVVKTGIFFGTVLAGGAPIKNRIFFIGAVLTECLKQLIKATWQI